MATITPLARTREAHSDFHKDLALLPGRNDIARKVNENSVKEAIKNVSNKLNISEIEIKKILQNEMNKLSKRTK